MNALKFYDQPTSPDNSKSPQTRPEEYPPSQAPKGVINNTLARRNKNIREEIKSEVIKGIPPQNRNRNSQLLFKGISDEAVDTEKVMQDKYMKNSTNLGQIKEDKREYNPSQATIRCDSKDLRGKITPRDQIQVEDNRLATSQVPIIKVDEKTKEQPSENTVLQIDPDVLQHVQKVKKLPINDILTLLQGGDQEITNLYKSTLDKKKRTMKTVYPSVIHSAISSPNNSRGSNLYISPEGSSSNPRDSKKAINAKPNALDMLSKLRSYGKTKLSTNPNSKAQGMYFHY